MLSKRQNFVETLKSDGKPDRLPNCYEALKIIIGDPIFKFTRGGLKKGGSITDCWGTVITFPEDQPAPIPYVTAQNQVIQDIEEWTEYVKVPDLDANCSDGWERAKESRAGIDSNEYLAAYIFGTGIFEQLHMLMTFDDTLCNLLMYPDEMHELIDAITEYRLNYIRLVMDNLHPDIIISHDDWGSSTSMFFSPDTWREFFKEPYRKIYEYIHSCGAIVMHHSDSFLEPIVEDMAEIGVDVWQGVLPTNDIVKLSRLLDGRMALMGGVASVIDREDAGEDEIRAEVRRCCDTYGGLKGFIPSYTYGDPGTIFPHVQPIIMDEIERWNKEHFNL